MFDLELDRLWDIYLGTLEKVHDRFGCRFHCFVLMGNHHHLILDTPNSNIDSAMRYLHREISRSANSAMGKINHFYGGKYKWSVIENELYYWNALKYVCLNPVKAGICRRAEQYRYSSLSTSFNGKPWYLTDFFDTEKDLIELDLDWVNQAQSDELDIAIKKGLNKREFKLCRDKSGRPIELDMWQRKKERDTFHTF